MPSIFSTAISLLGSRPIILALVFFFVMQGYFDFIGNPGSAIGNHGLLVTIYPSSLISTPLPDARCSGWICGPKLKTGTSQSSPMRFATQVVADALGGFWTRVPRPVPRCWRALVNPASTGVPVTVARRVPGVVYRETVIWTRTPEFFQESRLPSTRWLVPKLNSRGRSATIVSIS